MEIIERQMGFDTAGHQLQVALAASLVHDVGHGMFSHSFEDIGKKLNLRMARHEQVSADLIRGRDIAEIFKELGSGFAEDVANVLAKKEPTNLYDSVVSSQFDADRLDYMQRDRLMTGVQSSGIDATWLLSNLEIGSVRIVTDEEEVGTVDTLVLGPKAFRAAENYVLSLFQLYPNIYLHKTTRAAEKLFSCLMYRVFELVRSRHVGKVGLPKGHPIRRFVENPENIDNALTLDDAVFWGALPMMADAKDPLVRNCAAQLRERRLPKCIDIRQIVDEHAAIDMEVDLRQARIARSCKEIVERIQVFAQTRRPDQPQIFIDEARRAPYKKVEDSESPLNQILIKHGESRFEDMARLSPVVESAETFVVCRAYHEAGDTEGRSVIENIIKTQNRNAEDG